MKPRQVEVDQRFVQYATVNSEEKDSRCFGAVKLIRESKYYPMDTQDSPRDWLILAGILRHSKIYFMHVQSD